MTQTEVNELLESSLMKERAREAGFIHGTIIEAGTDACEIVRVIVETDKDQLRRLIVNPIGKPCRIEIL